MRSPFEQALQTVGKWAEELVREETEGQPPDDPQPSEETKALFVLLDNVPCDELRAAGVRILNESENPEVLQALLECWQAGLRGIAVVERWSTEFTPEWRTHKIGEEWAAWVLAPGGCSEDHPTRDAAILALRDALRAREGSERT